MHNADNLVLAAETSGKVHIRTHRAKNVRIRAKQTARAACGKAPSSEMVVQLRWRAKPDGRNIASASMYEPLESTTPQL